MEAAPMSAVVDLDASPATVLRSMRGSITDARLAYPEVLHVHVRDHSGGLWRLASQDAEWSPEDPAELVGRSIDRATIDVNGALVCELSDRAMLRLTPGSGGSSDDPPSWELMTPEGLVLEFGPGLRWQISGADAPPSRA